MPGKLALVTSGDFATAMGRADAVSSWTIGHYDLVCVFHPPTEWPVRYVVDFTFIPAGMPTSRCPRS